MSVWCPFCRKSLATCAHRNPELRLLDSRSTNQIVKELRNRTAGSRKSEPSDRRHPEISKLFVYERASVWSSSNRSDFVPDFRTIIEQPHILLYKRTVCKVYRNAIGSRGYTISIFVNSDLRLLRLVLREPEQKRTGGERDGNRGRRIYPACKAAELEGRGHALPAGSCGGLKRKRE